ncbi:hypothetical protein RJT34_29348 [Clitoria ternatea]|uniref:Peptidase S26 domain-containing protein n=1 Tax=Clitoria ternatea TaxID=43366 RepID=A0AAN9FIP7_CLITE
MRLVGNMAQWKSAAKEALDRTAIVAKFLCCLHVTSNYLCSPIHVYGPSMLPTLNLAGDVLLVDHLSPRIQNIARGDLVLVRSPLDPNRTITKRIVAMEGDTVTYFHPSHCDAPQLALVPKGHVWIQGDNIYASRDSRHFGPVPYGLVLGKVFFRVTVLPHATVLNVLLIIPLVWPLDSAGLLVRVNSRTYIAYKYTVNGVGLWVMKGVEKRRLGLDPVVPY